MARIIKIRIFREEFSKEFSFSEAEVKTSGPLNKEGIADFPLFKTLLAIHQKS